MVNQESMSKKTSIYVFVSDRLHFSLQVTFIQGSPVYGHTNIKKKITHYKFTGLFFLLTSQLVYMCSTMDLSTTI